MVPIEIKIHSTYVIETTEIHAEDTPEDWLTDDCKVFDLNSVKLPLSCLWSRNSVNIVFLNKLILRND